MARMPINPEVLRWALEDTGATPDDLANASDRDIDVVLQWLSGDLEPHRGELEKVGKYLGRSANFFLLPAPPARTTLAVQYRGRPGAVSDERAHEEILALKTSARIQRIAKRLTGEVVRFPQTSADPEKFAQSLRTWLQWETVDQAKAGTKSRAYRNLRDAIERRGVVVLELKIGPDRCRGFSLPDSSAPTLVINTAYDLPSLRSYTLIHELSHLARGEEYFCHGSDRNIERWCDRVAASFLMPRGDIAYYVSRNLKSSRIWENDADSVRLVANYFKTSWEASARRLVELGYAGAGLIAWITGSEPPEKGFNPNGGLRTHELRAREFGSRFSQLLVDAVDDDEISELDARRNLRVNADQYSALRTLLREGA
ncbi:ImmA/IrrE family metallo-endopeptidase [Promicromonospora sukumoe]